MNPAVDQYLAEGCGRCKLHATPDCKVHRWAAELRALRALLMSCGLTEERKWGMPCYTIKGKNVIMLFAWKDCCALSFFKGVLLTDTDGLLQLPGENSHEGRIVRFTSMQQIIDHEPALRTLVFEAIDAEEKGIKIPARPAAAQPMPEELATRLAADPALREAFTRLTPGRQRGYLLHIAGAKQSATREARIDRCAPSILAGKGLNE
jgi:uncharacterized protein YdeI (YjbR/CyaY-like superfamily)